MIDSVAFHAAQYRYRVEHLGCAAGRNVGALRDVGTDGQEHRVEAAGRLRLEHVADLRIELERDAEVEDAVDFRLQDLARQPVLRDPEAHHAARDRTGLADRDRVTPQREVIRRRQARRPGADDQNALARLGPRPLELPAAAQRLVAEEALDRVDAHGLVELAAVAGSFTGVVADAAHRGGQRVVAGEQAPGLLVFAGLGVEQPALDVLARRAGVIAGWQSVDVNGPDRAPGAGPVGEARARVERDRERLGLHRVASDSSSRP